MNIYWIWFKILNLEYKKKIKLLKIYRDIRKIYYLNTDTLRKTVDLNEKEVNNFIDKNIRNKAIEIDKINKENNIGVINILDEKYPYLLKQIYNPPILLYYKGDLELLKLKKINLYLGKNIDEYGENILKQLCLYFSKKEISVISRNENVDKKLINNNVKKIIVLAEGIKNIKVDNTGIILSEFEYDVVKTKTNVLQRNRILTGLSSENIIIQANILDGANYIVDLALEQGRDISVFPGNIFDVNNQFTNQLITEGANVINNINQLSVYEQ